jgi:hypothetical protein
MPTIRTLPREIFLSVSVDRDILLAGNKALAPEVRERPFGSNMLCVADHSIAVLVLLDMIDFSGNVEGCRFFASRVATLDYAQAFPLYPTEPPGH